MGKRGPAPTPTAHLEARGSWRAAINPAEPQPTGGEPSRPTELKGVAGEIWGRLLPLIGAGVLTCDNGETLARYCHALARWWKLAKWLDVNEDTYTVVDQLNNTRHVKHPNVKTYAETAMSLLRMEQEFGLTPSSRTRIHAVLNPEKLKPATGELPPLKIAN